jgi:H+/gluconate symporter-like permease
MKTLLLRVVVFFGTLGLFTWLISPKTRTVHSVTNIHVPKSEPTVVGIIIIILFITALIVLILFLKKKNRSCSKVSSNKKAAQKKQSNMEELTITLKVKYSGIGITEKDVVDYIAFQAGASCSISQDNPFFSEESESEIEIETI